MVPSLLNHMALRSSNRALWCALIACLPLTCGAASEDEMLTIDQELQALKAEVLDLNQSALRTETAFQYPDETRVSIFVGLQAPGLLVEDVVIAIDNNPPTVRKFDVIESVSLQRRGLYRALRLNTTPGSHRIRVDFSGRYVDAKPGTPPLRSHYEGVFEKTVQPSDLEVQVSVAAYGKPATIRLRDWRPNP